MIGTCIYYSHIILTHGVFSCKLQPFKCSPPHVVHFTHHSSSTVDCILRVVDLAHFSIDAIRRSSDLERCRRWRLNSCYAPEELACPVRVQITESDLNTGKDAISLADVAKEELNMLPCTKQVPPWGIFDENRSFDVETVNLPHEVRNNLHYEYKPVVHFLEERDEEVLSNRILILSQKSKPRAALDYFVSMITSGLKPNALACSALITCLGKDRSIVDALRVFEFTQRNRIATSQTYSSILKSVSCIHGYSAVLKMFWQLEYSSEARKDFDSDVYDTMIFAAGMKNDWLQADLLWRSMRENEIDEDPLTYHLLLSIFVRCRRNDLAYDVYVKAVHNGVKLGMEDMEPAMVACARNDKVVMAMTLFRNLLNDGVKPSIFSCVTLISSLCRIGKIKLIFQVYDLIKPLGCAETLRGMLAALYRARHHDVVLKLFMMIEKDRVPQMDPEFYHTALMSCRDVGLWDTAIEILWRMEASKLVVSTVSYNLVISACAIGRRLDASVQVYKHMLRMKCSPDRYTYLTMIKCFTARSLWAEVTEILNAVTRESCFYNAAIHGMCSNGNFQLAKKTYTRMRELNLEPDIRARNLMFQILCDFDKQKDANYPSKRSQ